MATTETEAGKGDVPVSGPTLQPTATRDLSEPREEQTPRPDDNQGDQTKRGVDETSNIEDLPSTESIRTKKPKRKSKQSRRRDDTDASDLEESIVDSVRRRRRRSQSPLEITSAQKDAIPSRLLQTLQYLDLMETRVKSLETELAAIQKKRDSHAEDDETSAHSADGSKDVDGYVRQKLVPGAHEVSYDVFSTEDGVNKNVLTYLIDDTFDRDRSGAIPDRTGKVARVSINSKIILDWLAKTLPKDAAPTEESRIVLAPFKPFVLYETPIRNYLATLKEELSRRESKPSMVDAGVDEVKIEDDQPAVQSTTAALLPTGKDESPLSRSLSQKSTNKDGTEVRELSDGAVQESFEHFETLVNFMNTYIKEESEAHKKLRYGDPTSVRFLQLWHMFHTGQIVCTDDENKQAYTVASVSGGRPLYGMPRSSDDSDDEDNRRSVNRRFRISNSYSPFVIECAHMDFDGTNFGPVGRSFQIDYFSGEKEISQLPVLPLRMVNDIGGQSRQNYLVERGRKFEKLTQNKVSHREYDGTSLLEKDRRDQNRSREQINSQVIIDFEHAYLSDWRAPTFSLPNVEGADERELPSGILGPCDCKPSCTATKVVLRHFDDRKLDREERDNFLENNDKLQLVQQLNDGQRMLLPNHVYGYVLRNLDWYRLDVDRVKPVDSSKVTSFEELILPKANRRLVEALVNSRRQETGKHARTERLDLVRGKGQGIIILLHGVPGTGKSSTAECIAEKLKCPLFALTCGNIGTTPGEVEENLQTMFYLAHKWNCVMLLDEADVFLQKRDEKDMSRNAVVSVFLRSLEYYSGILFLTTNKVGKFDEAFVSRIHMTLYYPMLDEQTTRDIWKVNLDRTRRHRPHIDFDESTLLQFAGWHFKEQERQKRIPWNGRQIRNAFQTAIALAEFEAASEDATMSPGVSDRAPIKATVTHEHFDQVASVSAEFNEYLRRTHAGGDTFDVAHNDQDRYDERKFYMSGFNQSRSAAPTMNYTSNSFRNSSPFTPGQPFYSDGNLSSQFQHQSNQTELRQPSSTNGFRPSSPNFNPNLSQSSNGGAFQSSLSSFQTSNGHGFGQVDNGVPPQVIFNPPLNDGQSAAIQTMLGGSQQPQQPNSQADPFMNHRQQFKPQQNSQHQHQYSGDSGQFSSTFTRQ